MTQTFIKELTSVKLCRDIGCFMRCWQILGHPARFLARLAVIGAISRGSGRWPTLGDFCRFRATLADVGAGSTIHSRVGQIWGTPDHFRVASAGVQADRLASHFLTPEESAKCLMAENWCRRQREAQESNLGLRNICQRPIDASDIKQGSSRAKHCFASGPGNSCNMEQDRMLHGTRCFLRVRRFMEQDRADDGQLRHDGLGSRWGRLFPHGARVISPLACRACLCSSPPSPTQVASTLSSLPAVRYFCAFRS